MIRNYYAINRYIRMKEMIDIQNEEIIAIGGRPGMGKTSFALKQVENYIKNTGKEVLYISSVPLSDYHKWTISLMPNNMQEKLHICEEIYKFSTEGAFREKYFHFLANNKNINLVVVDCYTDFVDSNFYDAASEFSEKFGVAVLCLVHIKRRVEKRKKHIPKLKDMKIPKSLNANRVFAVVRDNYYYEDGDNDLRLIFLK